MQTETISIVCADGYPLATTLLRGGAHDAVVIAPAMGVPRRFYEPFAAYLAARGYAALVFDYRGIGDSERGPQRGADMRMHDWGRLDIEAALGWSLRELQPARLFLVGHSAGGQLPGLAPSSERLNGLIAVAATAPHGRAYPPLSRLGLNLMWHGLIPLLTHQRDRFPARRIGMSNVDIPAGVIAQWARFARTPGYLFDPAHGLDTARYARLAMPILSYCFGDDGYAPEPAVDALLAHYSAAPITRRVIAADAHGPLGHFGFFREKHRDTLWREAAEWLESRCRAQRAYENLVPGQAGTAGPRLSVGTGEHP